VQGYDLFKVACNQMASNVSGWIREWGTGGDHNLRVGIVGRVVLARVRVASWWWVPG